MSRLCLRIFTSLLLVVGAAWGFPACSIGAGSAASCTDTTHASSCSGTFPCGNSGIHGECDAATQACVLTPGMVNCITIPGASASACPSFEQATAMAGCTPGLQQVCSGSSAEGITIDCQ
jgi:hypothetical protein